MLHFAMIVLILLNVWLEIPYLTYHWYDYPLGIFLLIMNPLMLYFVTKFGTLKKRKSFLYIYPSIALIVISISPYLIWKSWGRPLYFNICNVGRRFQGNI